MKKLFFIFIFIINISYGQYQEATITRTTSTNSVFPRQFPSMTIRKMNENEYWIFESLGTNTIFHRQFPTYIIRRENYGQTHPDQKWGVYRTTSTNSVFPRQFPDRYISSLDQEPEKEYEIKNIYKSTTVIQHKDIKNESSQNLDTSYTYTKSLRLDKKPSYNPESPE